MRIAGANGALLARQAPVPDPCAAQEMLESSNDNEDLERLGAEILGHGTGPFGQRQKETELMDSNYSSND
jgi:hypothetical protein